MKLIKIIIIFLFATVISAKNCFAASYFTEDNTFDFENLNVGESKWADFNGDGRWDIAAYGVDSSGQAKVYLYQNNPAGFSKTTEFLVGDYVLGIGSLAWGDYENDGDSDLLVVGKSEGGVNNTGLYINDGSGDFTKKSVTGLPVTQDAASEWIDFNNDGIMDIVIIGKNIVEKPCGVYINNGDGSFTVKNFPSLPYGQIQYGSLASGDYNNDGYIDILAAGDLSSGGGGERVETHIFENVEGSTFTDIVVSSTGIRRGDAAWGDMDNDGDLDLVISGVDDSGSRITDVYENSGSPNYNLNKSTGLAGLEYASVALADINKDYLMDIAIMGNNGGTQSTLIYENIGGLKFSSYDSLIPLEGGSVSFSDYSGDGNPDIYIHGATTTANSTYNTRLYENDSSSKTPPAAVSATKMSSFYIDDKLYIMWNDPEGVTKSTAASYYYNFRVGTVEGQDDLVPARYGSPLLGNYITKATSSSLKGRGIYPNIDDGTVDVSGHKHVRVMNVKGSNYYWAVQSIDPALGYTWRVFGSTGGWSSEEIFKDTSSPTGLPSVPADEGEYKYNKKLAFSWNKGTARDPQTDIYGCYVEVKEEDSSGNTKVVVSSDISNKHNVKVWDNSGSASYSYGGELNKTYYMRVKARHGYTLNLPEEVYKSTTTTSYSGESDKDWLWDPDSPHYTGWSEWSDGISIIELLSINYNLIRNPGSEYAEINYNLKKDGNVKIRIFNIMGELVKTVLDDYISVAGTTKQEKWYGKNDGGKVVASGLYYVNIQAAGTEETKKIVVVK